MDKKQQKEVLKKILKGRKEIPGRKNPIVPEISDSRTLGEVADLNKGAKTVSEIDLM